MSFGCPRVIRCGRAAPAPSRFAVSGSFAKSSNTTTPHSRPGGWPDDESHPNEVSRGIANRGRPRIARKALVRLQIETIYGKNSLQIRITQMHRKKRRPGIGYRIGYCRPPKRTRFKKGTSGNPKGRRKGSRNRVNHRLALDKLVAIMKSKRTPTAVQMKAAKIILDLAFQAAGLSE